MKATPGAGSPGDRFHEITSQDDLSRIVACAATSGRSHHADLLRQASSGRFNLVQVDRTSIPPTRWLKHSRRPVLVMIGDDDYASTGPAGWAALPKLLRWAHSAMIHGTGADVASYRAAAGMAVTAKRFLLIETSSAFVDAWAAVLSAARIPSIALRPPAGGLHPLPLDRRAMQ
jgi:hypothetical protein